MRKIVLAALIGAICVSAASAQTPSKLPKNPLPAPNLPVQKPATQATPNTTVNAQAATVNDYDAPDAGKRWRIHPVRYGLISRRQIQNDNQTRVIGYRDQYRSVTVSVINASFMKAARVRIDCDDPERIRESNRGVQIVEKNASWALSLQNTDSANKTADCTIASDTPVHVAVLVEDKIIELDEQARAGSGFVMSLSTVNWPVFRLSGPQ